MKAIQTCTLLSLVVLSFKLFPSDLTPESHNPFVPLTEDSGQCSKQLVAEAPSDTPIAFKRFHIKFKNEVYAYEINLKHGEYIIDAHFGDVAGTLDDHDYWRPPQPGQKIELTRAFENSKGTFVVFKVGKEIEVHEREAGHSKNRRIQQQYLVSIPHDLSVSGKVARIYVNPETNTPADFIGFSSVLRGDDFMEVGTVSEATIELEPTRDQALAQNWREILEMEDEMRATVAHAEELIRQKRIQSSTIEIFKRHLKRIDEHRNRSGR